MGWVGGKVLPKGGELTLVARTDYGQISATAQFSHTAQNRTAFSSYYCR
jgi:hypothetical protein